MLLLDIKELLRKKSIALTGSREITHVELLDSKIRLHGTALCPCRGACQVESSRGCDCTEESHICKYICEFDDEYPIDEHYLVNEYLVNEYYPKTLIPLKTWERLMSTFKNGYDVRIMPNKMEFIHMENMNEKEKITIKWK